MFGAHLVGLLEVSQAFLELVASGGSVEVVAFLFSQCIVVWRSLPWARGSGAKVSTLPGASPLPSVVPASQPGP
jgi:hypothetical protein